MGKNVDSFIFITWFSEKRELIRKAAKTNTTRFIHRQILHIFAHIFRNPLPPHTHTYESSNFLYPACGNWSIWWIIIYWKVEWERKIGKKEYKCRAQVKKLGDVIAYTMWGYRNFHAHHHSVVWSSNRRISIFGRVAWVYPIRKGIMTLYRIFLWEYQ